MWRLSTDQRSDRCFSSPSFSSIALIRVMCISTMDWSTIIRIIVAMSSRVMIINCWTKSIVWSANVNHLKKPRMEPIWISHLVEPLPIPNSMVSLPTVSIPPLAVSSARWSLFEIPSRWNIRTTMKMFPWISWALPGQLTKRWNSKILRMRKNVDHLASIHFSSCHWRNVSFVALSKDFEGNARPPNWQLTAWQLDPSSDSNNGYENEDFLVWMRTA